jgi:hypothetical protein
MYSFSSLTDASAAAGANDSRLFLTLSYPFGGPIPGTKVTGLLSTVFPGHLHARSRSHEFGANRILNRFAWISRRLLQLEARD